jgi:hypothetical protein
MVWEIFWRDIFRIAGGLIDTELGQSARSTLRVRTSCDQDYVLFCTVRMIHTVHRLGNFIYDHESPVTCERQNEIGFCVYRLVLQTRLQDYVSSFIYFSNSLRTLSLKSRLAFARSWEAPAPDYSPPGYWVQSCTCRMQRIVVRRPKGRNRHIEYTPNFEARQRVSWVFLSIFQFHCTSTTTERIVLAIVCLLSLSKTLSAL